MYRGRVQEPEGVAQLTRAVSEYIVRNGVAAVSLRPLANALGVSTYKLLYHFDSKENLIHVALLQAVERQVEEVRSWLAETSPSTVGGVMKRYWEWFLLPENRAVTRLIFEVNGLALQEPERYPDAITTIIQESLDLEKQIAHRQGLAGEAAERVASMVCATVWGLQFDLLNTDDAARTTIALQESAAMIDAYIASAQDARAAAHHEGGEA